MRGPLAKPSGRPALRFRKNGAPFPILRRKPHSRRGTHTKYTPRSTRRMPPRLHTHKFVPENPKSKACP
ncbi:hypothetical protein ROLI_027380 [Roseobacter fucihabitans]|uniref:Uncharacterized protein n=1 Tax=Roseobacter fucihabitans TaxID=1537242 RepID=A0ABZ2BW96_9RHOB|nr:hypothetical protein [Roseobacter litoralis]